MSRIITSKPRVIYCTRRVKRRHNCSMCVVQCVMSSVRDAHSGTCQVAASAVPAHQVAEGTCSHQQCLLLECCIASYHVEWLQITEIGFQLCPFQVGTLFLDHCVESFVTLSCLQDQIQFELIVVKVLWLELHCHGSWLLPLWPWVILSRYIFLFCRVRRNRRAIYTSKWIKQVHACV